MQRMGKPWWSQTDCLQDMSTGQLLHHCSVLITSASYFTTLTSACKMKSWTSPKRGHLRPPQDSAGITLGKEEEHDHVSETKLLNEKREEMGRYFHQLWHQHRNVASCTVLAPTAIFSWKLNPLFLGLPLSGSSEVWLLPTGGRQRKSHGWQGRAFASQDKHLSTYSTWAKWVWQAQRSWPGSTRSQDQQAGPWWQGRSEVKLGRQSITLGSITRCRHSYGWGWGISNSHSTSQECKGRSWVGLLGPQMGGVGEGPMRLLGAIKTSQCPDTWIYCTTTEMGTQKYRDLPNWGRN